MSLLMKKSFYNLFVLICLLAIPGASFAASSLESPEVTSLDSWISEKMSVEENPEDEPAFVLRRLAIELDTLEEDVASLDALAEKSSWFVSLRAAWEEHTIRVQMRRIQLLLLSADRQELLSAEARTMIDEYLVLVATQLGE